MALKLTCECLAETLARLQSLDEQLTVSNFWRAFGPVWTSRTKGTRHITKIRTFCQHWTKRQKSPPLDALLLFLLEHSSLVTILTRHQPSSPASKPANDGLQSDGLRSDDNGQEVKEVVEDHSTNLRVADAGHKRTRRPSELAKGIGADEALDPESLLVVRGNESQESIACDMKQAVENTVLTLFEDGEPLASSTDGNSGADSASGDGSGSGGGSGVDGASGGDGGSGSFEPSLYELVAAYRDRKVRERFDKRARGDASSREASVEASSSGLTSGTSLLTLLDDLKDEPWYKDQMQLYVEEPKQIQKGVLQQQAKLEISVVQVLHDEYSRRSTQQPQDHVPAQEPTHPSTHPSTHPLTHPQVPNQHRSPPSQGRSLPDKGRSQLRVELYSHQAVALDALLLGEDVCVSTSTASGKSLVFMSYAVNMILQNPERTVLCIYPTKALAQDQHSKWTAFAKKTAEGDVAVGIIDGDTEFAARRAICERSNVLLTNFDFVHKGVLAQRAQYADFLTRLGFLIVDEAHMYRGMFGAHAALTLRRILMMNQYLVEKARFESSKMSSSGAVIDKVMFRAIGKRERVQIMTATATLGNPADHFRLLTGRSHCRSVSNDGSPTDLKYLVLWDPPPLQYGALDPALLSFQSNKANAFSGAAEGAYWDLSRTSAVAEPVPSTLLEPLTGVVLQPPPLITPPTPSLPHPTTEVLPVEVSPVEVSPEAAAGAFPIKEEEMFKISAINEAIRLFVFMIKRNVKTFLFCNARNLVELVFASVEKQLSRRAADREVMRRVVAYRGGYTKETRRTLERKIFRNEACGVISTNALELGIDLGLLDVVLTLGFEGSVSSVRQRLGRAGRSQRPSLGFLVAFDSPVERYVVKYLGNSFWKKQAEPVAFDPENILLLKQHLMCAMAEIGQPVPFALLRAFFGPSVERAVRIALATDEIGVFTPARPRKTSAGKGSRKRGSKGGKAEADVVEEEKGEECEGEDEDEGNAVVDLQDRTMLRFKLTSKYLIMSAGDEAQEHAKEAVYRGEQERLEAVKAQARDMRQREGGEGGHPSLLSLPFMDPKHRERKEDAGISLEERRRRGSQTMTKEELEVLAQKSMPKLLVIGGVSVAERPIFFLTDVSDLKDSKKFLKKPHGIVDLRSSGVPNVTVYSIGVASGGASSAGPSRGPAGGRFGGSFGGSRRGGPNVGTGMDPTEERRLREGSGVLTGGEDELKGMEIVDEVPMINAFFSLYPGAVYVVRGQEYLVKIFNYRQRYAVCQLERKKLDYYTSASDHNHHKLLRIDRVLRAQKTQRERPHTSPSHTSPQHTSQLHTSHSHTSPPHTSPSHTSPHSTVDHSTVEKREVDEPVFEPVSEENDFSVDEVASDCGQLLTGDAQIFLGPTRVTWSVQSFWKQGKTSGSRVKKERVALDLPDVAFDTRGIMIDWTWEGLGKFQRRAEPVLLRQPGVNLEGFTGGASYEESLLTAGLHGLGHLLCKAACTVVWCDLRELECNCPFGGSHTSKTRPKLFLYERPSTLALGIADILFRENGAKMAELLLTAKRMLTSCKCHNDLAASGCLDCVLLPYCVERNVLVNTHAAKFLLENLIHF